MTESHLVPLVVALALVFSYPFVAAFLLRLTEGTRAEMASIGRELLVSPHYSEEQKQLISAMLDDVFDWRFMAFACFYFPVIVVMTVFHRGRLPDADRRFARDPEVVKFFDLHMRATSAAAPLWTVLFYLVALVVLLLAVAFIGISILSQLWLGTVQEVSPRIGYHHDLHATTD